MLLISPCVVDIWLPMPILGWYDILLLTEWDVYVWLQINSILSQGYLGFASVHTRWHTQAPRHRISTSTTGSDRPKTPVCPIFNIFGNTGVAGLLAVSLSRRNTTRKKVLLPEKSSEKIPWSPIRILLHFTYWLNEVICSHLNDSISVKHGASLVMENKWGPYPVETTLSTGRNIKRRQAPAPSSLFPFATSACCHVSIVEDGSV